MQLQHIFNYFENIWINQFWIIINNSKGAPTVFKPDSGYGYFLNEVKSLGGDVNKLRK